MGLSETRHPIVLPKKYFQVLFADKEFQQLPSASKPNACKTSWLDKLVFYPGCLKPVSLSWSSIQDTVKAAFRKLQRGRPFHTGPKLRPRRVKTAFPSFIFTDRF